MSQYLTVGMAGETPIVVDWLSVVASYVGRNADGTSYVPNAVSVTLTEDYQMLQPNSIYGPFPTRPFMTSASQPSLGLPRTISSGTTIALTKPEADALVTADAATYA
jgi:hypothetical protein